MVEIFWTLLKCPQKKGVNSGRTESIFLPREKEQWDGTRPGRTVLFSNPYSSLPRGTRTPAIEKDTLPSSSRTHFMTLWRNVLKRRASTVAVLSPFFSGEKRNSETGRVLVGRSYFHAPRAPFPGGLGPPRLRRTRFPLAVAHISWLSDEMCSKEERQLWPY